MSAKPALAGLDEALHKARRPRASPQDVMASLHDEPVDMQLPPALGTDGTNSPVDDCDWWQTAPLPENKKTAATVDAPLRRLSGICAEATADVVRATGGLNGQAHAADVWGPMLADMLPTASETTPLSAHARQFVPCSASKLKADAPAFTVKQAQEASEKKRSKNKLNSAVPMPSVRFQRSLEEEAPIVTVWKWWRIVHAADLSRAGEALAVIA